MKKITATAEELAQIYLQGHSLEQIGKMFGVTREAIRQKFVENGYVVRDLQRNLKVKQTETRKKLADDLLIESTNRQIKIFWDRARYSDQKYRNACNQLKKYRAVITEIKGYLKTLSSIDSDFINTETYLRIMDSIEKVNFYKQWQNKRSKQCGN